MEYVARLLGEAWAHRRRRRQRMVGWALVACAGAGLIYAIAGRSSTSAPSAGIPEPAGTVAQPASAVFSKPPYMGVICPVPNSIACDRIGLAIWLKRPARSVTASINGRLLMMNRFGDELVSSTRPRKAFDGYLQPAGTTTTMHVRPVRGTHLWLGTPTPFESVWLLIDYGSGNYVAAHTRVPLEAGWG